MERPRFKKDYEVGYGKPPKSAQFPPGFCGNRAGRPKGARNLNTIVNAALNEEITVTENGSKRRITKLELIIKRLVDRGSDGDLRAVAMLLERLDGQRKTTDPQDSTEMDDQDKAILQGALDRIRKQPEDSNDK